MKKINFVLFFIFSIFSLRTQAQGRGEDPTFNSGTGFNARVSQIVLEPDEKILVIGSFTEYNGTPANRIIRLNADGSRDESFQIGTGFNGLPRKMVLQSDGKILVGGDFTEYNGILSKYIIRLNPNGSVDDNFSVGSGFANSIFGIALQEDQKILLAGGGGKYKGDTCSYPVARLHSDGMIDNSFNLDLSTFNGPYSSKPSAYFVGVQPSGKIIVGGYFYKSDGINPLIIRQCIRFNVDGALDNEFSGYSTYPSFYSPISGIALQSDGKILIGYFQDFDINYPGAELSFIKRLHTNGSPDNTYRESAHVPSNYSFSMQPDGKIIITSKTYNYMARYDSTGNIDKSFNAGNVFDSEISTVVTQSNGKILVGGNFTAYDGFPRNRIIRLIDGFIPLDINEFSVYPNPVSDYLNLFVNPNSIWQITDTFGRIVMEGKTENFNSQIDIRVLPQGIYIFHLTDPQGNKVTKRIIKS